MIIDDDPALRQVLTIRMLAAGYEVQTAQDSNDALEIVLKTPPDLIVLDIQMPHFSGLDFHRSMLKTEPGRTIPVIYLSGSGSAENRMIAARLGAKAFFDKPYDAIELLDTIGAVLSENASSTPTCNMCTTSCTGGCVVQ